MVHIGPFTPGRCADASDDAQLQLAAAPTLQPTLVPANHRRLILERRQPHEKLPAHRCSILTPGRVMETV